MLLLAAVGLEFRVRVAESHSFTNLNRSIPDGNLSGLSDTRSITSSIRSMAGLRVSLRVQGEFNGDLYGYVRHAHGGNTNFCVLLNRPGKSAAASAGYADAALDVVFDDAAANGDIHLYRKIITLSPGSPVTGEWQPDGRNVSPTVVTEATPRTTTLQSFLGADADGEWTLYLVDADRGGTNMLVSWGLEITGTAIPPISWPAPPDIVYGTPLALAQSQLNATSSIPGTFTYDPPPGTVLNAGNGQVLSVTFTPLDTTNYAPATANVLINVLKKDLVIISQDATKDYGAAVPALGASYNGFVNGDTPADLDTPATLTTTATAASPVGDYTITVGGAADANCEITHVPGTLTINRAALTITAEDKGKPYGAALPVLTANYSGLMNGDTPASLDSPVSLSTTATTASSVGSYNISASGASDANYMITHVNGTLTVSPAALFITARDKSKLYGAALPMLTAAYSGFVNGDTPASLDSPVSLGTPATAGSSVGSYLITASGAADANYTITHANGTLTVSPATLTILAGNKTKVYGDAVPELTANYSGFVNGDTFASLDTAASLSTTATAASPVGSYAITANCASDANYAINNVPGVLTVTPAALVITVEDKTKLFGAALPELTASYSGLVNGDTPASLDSPASLSTTATAASPTGAYPITASGASSANYMITYVYGTLTVTGTSTTGLLMSASNPELPGVDLNFTFTVSVARPGSGTPTGQVRFRLNGASLGMLNLSGGRADLYIFGGLPPGPHTLSAEYMGNTSFLGATNTLILSPSGTKPASGERIKTGHSEVRIS